MTKAALSCIMRLTDMGSIIKIAHYVGAVFLMGAVPQKFPGRLKVGLRLPFSDPDVNIYKFDFFARSNHAMKMSNGKERPPVMEKDNKFSSTDSGFELDKVDISRIAKPNPPAASPKATKVPKAASVAAPETEKEVPADGKRKLPQWKWIAVGAGVVVVLAAAAFWMMAGRSPTPSPSAKAGPYDKPETYISVGPVIATVSSGDKLKVTLDINCAKVEYQKTVSELEAKIREQVVSALQSPEAEQFLTAGDYAALRSLLSAKVMAVLPAGTATEIYLSGFLRY